MPITDAVVADNAAFRYGSDAPVATGVTVAVPAGSALALIGPNGAGKSTIILGLLGLTTVHEGRVSVLGTTPDRARGSVGFVPQSLSLDPQFPVSLEQVVGMGRYRRLGWRWPGHDDREAVRAALRRVGLDALRRRRFGMLSGGQQQRGLLARALVANPKLMVLDEPFNGLDQTNRDALLEIVRELKKSDVAFVISTHDLDLAREVCDQVLLINGAQVAAGPTDAVLTLENLETVFAGHQVELDEHTVIVPPHEGHA